MKQHKSYRHLCYPKQFKTDFRPQLSLSLKFQSDPISRQSIWHSVAVHSFTRHFRPTSCAHVPPAGPLLLITVYCCSQPGSGISQQLPYTDVSTLGCSIRHSAIRQVARIRIRIRIRQTHARIKPPIENPNLKTYCKSPCKEYNCVAEAVDRLFDPGRSSRLRRE